MLVAVMVALTACGGGGASSDGAVVTTAPVPVPGAAVAASSNSSDVLSPSQIVLNEQFPTSVESVPAEILVKLRAKRPMLIVYMDSTQVVNSDQWNEIDAVMEKYRGLIDLLSYDVAAGLVSVETSKPTDLQKAMSLAGSINVKNAPYMIFVDRYGRVIGRFLGFTDRTLLEREVLRATS